MSSRAPNETRADVARRLGVIDPDDTVVQRNDPDWGWTEDDPGSTAPDASRTMPAMDCAWAASGKRRMTPRSRALPKQRIRAYLRGHHGPASTRTFAGGRTN